jgi:hypothetical protein
VSEEPLRYMRKYLRVEEELEEPEPVVVVDDTELDED